MADLERYVVGVADGYHLSYDKLLGYMGSIFERNSSFCKYDVHYMRNRESDTGDVFSDSFWPVGSIPYHYRPMKVRIGVKSLEANMLPSGMVRDDDAVWALMQTFHESAHVWQYSVGYMQRGDRSQDGVKVMARDKVIGSCFEEHRKLSYPYDSSELYAWEYSVSQIKGFFERLSKDSDEFGQVDVDGIVCDFVKRAHGVVWPEFNDCNTIDDVSRAYAEIREIAPYVKKFDIVRMSGFNYKSEPLYRLLHDNDAVHQVLSAENGIEETEVLCQYIGRCYPDYFRSALCIRDEYCGYDFRGSVERVLSAVYGIRPSRTCDDLSDISDGDLSSESDLSL